jgi:hypothetical protein
MKVLVIGGDSAFGSRTSRMLAALHQVLDDDVEVIHEPDGKMRGHTVDVLIVDEMQSKQGKDLTFLERCGNAGPLVQMDYADLERRVISNLHHTQFRAFDYLEPAFEPIKPKPNTGPRGRWGKAL